MKLTLKKYIEYIESSLLPGYYNFSSLLFVLGYGMTEASPLVTFSPIILQNTPEGRGSVGTPIPNTLLKIIDVENPTGRLLDTDSYR